jgi:peptide/nickel transport system permease protein
MPWWTLDALVTLAGIATPIVILLAILRVRRQPLWAEAFRRIRRNRLAMVCLALLSVYGTIAFLDSLIWRENKNAQPRSVVDRVFERPREPTYSAPMARYTLAERPPRRLKGMHILGTDGTGADVFYQTLKGARTAFVVGVFTYVVATPIALLAGMLAGYYGRRVDDAVQYVYTVLDSIPYILLLIALMLLLGQGLPQLVVALGITSWVGLCRLTRGETLKHRERDYVRGAKALGASDWQILTRHILPNLTPLILISVTLGVSGQILAETVLSYIGIGVEPGTGSWGMMIDAARQELARDPVVWWSFTSAVVAIFILVLAFNLFADALRDSLDPRLRSG